MLRHKSSFTGFFLIWGVSMPLLALLWALPCAKASDMDKVSLQLKWKHQFQFAGFYAAVEQGYYREARLDVDIREGRPGLVATEEVVAARADFGVESPALLLARNQGQPVVVLAAILQHSAEVLVSTKASGIASPHDLIGRRVLMRPRVDAEILAMLKNEGIAYDRIQIIEHTWNLNDLIEGRVDVYGGYITDVPFLLTRQGIPNTVISPLTYGVDFYGDCLFTTEARIADAPEQVRAFREASLKGWDFAMKNPDQVIEFILRKYSTRVSRQALSFEAAAMQQLMQPKFIEVGHMNPGRWKHIADTFVKVGMLASDYSLQGFIYDPDPPPDTRKTMIMIKVLLALASAVGLVTVLLLVFNLRLKRLVARRTAHLTEEVHRRLKAQQELQASLAEKEILLKEVHHRVKNNLQMVESLLNLQVLEMKDKKQADPIQDSKNRVHSMALVHETLYRSEEFNAIDIRSYIEQLVSPMVQSMQPPRVEIDVVYDVDPISMDLDTAVACGLIVNELVSNSLKHAFRHARTGTISIHLKEVQNNRLRLEVGDDGIGMDADMDMERQGALGMQIVQLIAERQLEADTRLDHGDGFQFVLEFSSNKGSANDRSS